MAIFVFCAEISSRARCSNLVYPVARTGRIERIGQIGIIAMNYTAFFDSVQNTFNTLEEVINKGKEKGWELDPEVPPAEEKLRSILKRKAMFLRNAQRRRYYHRKNPDLWM